MNLSEIEESISQLNKMIGLLFKVIDKQSKIVNQYEQYLVPSQVCELLSINRSTFDRFVKMGIFKIYRLGKAKVYVKRSDIDQLFENQIEKS